MRKNNSQNSYRQELRERILATAMNEFYTKGIKAVKMDDIAKRLSISKRTLYEIYQNKEELLLEGMKAAEAEFDAHMKAFSFQQSNNVMDILIEFYHYQVTKLAKITPAYYEDLHKYSLITEYLHSKQSERDKPKSVIRISLCRTAKRNPLIFSIWIRMIVVFLVIWPNIGYACLLFSPGRLALIAIRTELFSEISSCWN